MNLRFFSVVSALVWAQTSVAITQLEELQNCAMSLFVSISNPNDPQTPCPLEDQKRIDVRTLCETGSFLDLIESCKEHNDRQQGLSSASLQSTSPSAQKATRGKEIASSPTARGMDLTLIFKGWRHFPSFEMPCVQHVVILDPEFVPYFPAHNPFSDLKDITVDHRGFTWPPSWDVDVNLCHTTFLFDPLKSVCVFAYADPYLTSEYKENKIGTELGFSKEGRPLFKHTTTPFSASVDLEALAFLPSSFEGALSSLHSHGESAVMGGGVEVGSKWTVEDGLLWSAKILENPSPNLNLSGFFSHQPFYRRQINRALHAIELGAQEMTSQFELRCPESADLQLVVQTIKIVPVGVQSDEPFASKVFEVNVAWRLPEGSRSFFEMGPFVLKKNNDPQPEAISSEADAQILLSNVMISFGMGEWYGVMNSRGPETSKMPITSGGASDPQDIRSVTGLLDTLRTA